MYFLLKTASVSVCVCHVRRSGVTAAVASTRLAIGAYCVMRCTTFDRKTIDRIRHFIEQTFGRMRHLTE